MNEKNLRAEISKEIIKLNRKNLEEAKRIFEDGGITPLKRSVKYCGIRT